GRPDGELDVRLPPLELVPISAARLRGAFDDAGIRYRVVVVSACRAGSFVDAFADEDSAVIVASAADAASPACGPDGDATAFGRAFFEDGIAKGASLAEAFDAARARIEAADTAARPRMHIGAGIAARLADVGRKGGTQQQVRLSAARHG
ncbi:MAG TPA: C13 family peptidase, partial [Casimicrobiaceae bacterium]|nr:C13 family peptidase [Casimicrobiaceae bacterium]